MNNKRPRNTKKVGGTGRLVRYLGLTERKSRKGEGEGREIKRETKRQRDRETERQRQRDRETQSITSLTARLLMARVAWKIPHHCSYG